MRTLREDTIQNMNILKDLVEAIVQTLPYSFKEEDEYGFLGGDVQGFRTLYDKYKGSQYEPAMEAFRRLFIRFVNKKHAIGTTYGAFAILTDQHHYLTVCVSAIMGSAEKHLTKDVINHRMDNNTIRSMRSVLVHELRHFFQAVFYKDYFVNSANKGYKANPVEIDAAWKHHLEDFHPSDFESAVKYANVVMNSFATYKTITPQQNRHYRRKTIRYWLDTRFGRRDEPRGATPAERFAHKIEATNKAIASYLFVKHDVDMRNVIPEYEWKSWFFPERTLNACGSLIAQGKSPEVVAKSPKNGVILLLAIAITVPEEKMLSVAPYLKRYWKTDLSSFLPHADEAFERWNVDQIKRFLKDRYSI